MAVATFKYRFYITIHVNSLITIFVSIGNSIISRAIDLSPYSTRRAKHDGRRMRCAFERNGRRMSDRFRSIEESADF